LSALPLAKSSPLGLKATDLTWSLPSPQIFSNVRYVAALFPLERGGGVELNNAELATFRKV
jgi:hypothetical protein